MIVTSELEPIDANVNMDVQHLFTEIDTLKSLYSSNAISFIAPTEDRAGVVSIKLHEILGNDSASAPLTLATQLPKTYPIEARPKRPTLRGGGISASRCEELVDLMLQRETSLDGEVCLFEYCEAMLSVIREAVHEPEQREREHSPQSEAPEESGKDTASYTIFHGEPLTDRKSVFQAHLASVSSSTEIEALLQQLLEKNRKIETATHNTLAWRVQGERSVVQDCDDDGEKGAGKYVLYVMKQMKANDCVVVVSRWFGGIKLGPVRFRHISNVVRDILEAHGQEVGKEV